MRRSPCTALTGLALAGLALAGLLAGCDSAAGGTPGAGTRAARTTTAAPVADIRPCPQQPKEAASGPQTLPPLELRCLGGGTLDLGRAPGVPTVVNLWASWCGPCREELPLVQQFAADAGNHVRVVGVVSKDGRQQAVAFAADAGATFPSAFDGEGELMTRLGLRGLPYTYLLDAQGAVVFTQVGPVTSEDQLRSLVAEHLGVQL